MPITRRREFIQTLAAGGAASRLRAATASRPNVIILLTDDQGYGDLSCHGNPALKTPNLDRLHSESVRFTDFHVAPMCTPTRGQLMTGMDALHNGATSVTAGRAIIRKNIPTMADVFSAGGYRTGIFGKWHLGDDYPYRPMERGFQEAVYFRGFGLSSAPEFDNDYFNGTYQHNGVSKRFDGYCTDFWFREAMAWMAEQKKNNQPFFCYLPTNAPHGPLWVDEKYAAPYRKPKMPANFFGMIANIDENYGKLDEFLRRNNLRDNTLLIYMSDNGATAGYQFYNAGMRGKKTMIYDGGHRVPCFIRWPAANFGGPRDIKGAVQIQDLLPTFIDLFGLKKPANANFDGRSLASVLRNPSEKVADRMMVVQYGQIPVKWDACVIWNQWRLIRGEELYDIHADPAQAKDVAKATPDVVRRMRDHYDRWWDRVSPLLNDFALISLGADQSNPVRLTCSDWQDVYCDNPGHVSEAVGGPQGGPWNVVIEKDGNYEITLTRWPAHLNLALDAGRAAQKMTAGMLPPGKAMPIRGAKLTIAGQQLSAKANPGDKNIVLRTKLQGGTKTKLHAWFTDAAGQDLCGVFYASVKRV